MFASSRPPEALRIYLLLRSLDFCLIGLPVSSCLGRSIGEGWRVRNVRRASFVDVPPVTARRLLQQGAATSAPFTLPSAAVAAAAAWPGQASELPPPPALLLGTDAQARKKPSLRWPPSARNKTRLRKARTRARPSNSSFLAGEPAATKPLAGNQKGPAGPAGPKRSRAPAIQLYEEPTILAQQYGALLSPN